MDNPDVSITNIDELSKWFKVLCEPNRLLLLDSIVGGVQCNCDLGETLGLSPNLISHHLSILRETGIIEATRDPSDARWIYYSVNPTVMDQLQNLLSTFLDSDRIQPLSFQCGPKNSCS